MAPTAVILCLALPAPPSKGDAYDDWIKVHEEALDMSDFVTSSKVIPNIVAYVKKITGAQSYEYAYALSLQCVDNTYANRFSEAKNICSAAIEASKAGKDHQKTRLEYQAMASMMVGAIFLAEKQDQKAEKWFKEALAVFSRQSGSDPSFMAHKLEWAGSIYGIWDRCEQALRFYQAALKTRQGIKNNDLDIAANLVSQIECLAELKRVQESTALFNKSAKLIKTAYKSDNEGRMLIFQLTYARILHLNKDLASAENLLRSIISKTQGKKNQWTVLATAQHQLANILVDKKAYPEAEKLYRQSAAMVSKYMGPNHIHNRDNVNGLARIYKETGNTKEAEKIAQWRAALPL